MLPIANLHFCGEIINNTAVIFAIDDDRSEFDVICRNVPWSTETALQIARSIADELVTRRELTPTQQPYVAKIVADIIAGFDPGYPFVLASHSLQMIIDDLLPRHIDVSDDDSSTIGTALDQWLSVTAPSVQMLKRAQARNQSPAFISTPDSLEYEEDYDYHEEDEDNDAF